MNCEICGGPLHKNAKIAKARAEMGLTLCTDDACQRHIAKPRIHSFARG